jgi:hypothetical protein
MGLSCLMSSQRPKGNELNLCFEQDNYQQSIKELIVVIVELDGRKVSSSRPKKKKSTVDRVSYIVVGSAS